MESLTIFAMDIRHHPSTIRVVPEILTDFCPTWLRQNNEYHAGFLKILKRNQ